MAALVVSPLELFRTRMQSAEGINGFSGNACIETYFNERNGD